MSGQSGSPGGTGLRVCLFGLGEAGGLLATDLVDAGVAVSAYDPAEVPTPAGVTRRVHPALAARPVDVVVGATGGGEARLALLQAIDAMAPGTLYADVSTSSPGLKLHLADEAVQRDLKFVDVALMSMVPGNGLATPALAAGLGAGRLADLLNPLGARVEPIDGPPGSATAKKLLRSVLMKGTASLLVEAVRAGAAADDLAWLWNNLADEFDVAGEPWMRRLVAGSRLHARRRLGEMEAAAAMLETLGIEPTMTRATVASLTDLVAGAGIPDLPPDLLPPDGPPELSPDQE
ncbi:MAG: DUF1932 domain-containing protein [Actinomycetota bacterium]